MYWPRLEVGKQLDDGHAGTAQRIPDNVFVFEFII